MTGTIMFRRGRSIGCLLLTAALGCPDAAPSITTAVQQGADRPPPPGVPTALIRGRVTWNGPLPEVPPLDVAAYPFGGPVLRQRQRRPNPNRPAIDPLSRGLANAVVYLRGVPVEQARPWDHPPVEVELHSDGFAVRQGQDVSRVGFVRRGAAVTLVSRQEVLHGCRGRGAAFFSLMFPDRDRPLQRRLTEPGLVELSSSAGYYWMRAYLFVDDHPYYARTDGTGQFTLPAVPPGRYELVCWLPNWKVQRQEREPEVGAVVRLYFEPPHEQTRPICIGGGIQETIDFVWP